MEKTLITLSLLISILSCSVNRNALNHETNDINIIDPATLNKEQICIDKIRKVRSGTCYYQSQIYPGKYCEIYCQGSSNDHLYTLARNLLSQLGYELCEDTGFCTSDGNALQDFQEKNGLLPNLLDEATLYKLLNSKPE